MSDDNGEPFYEWDDDAAPEGGADVEDILAPYRGKRYIKVDSARLTYGEYWRMSPAIFVWAIMVVLKTAGIRVPLASGIPYPDEIIYLERSDLSLSGGENLIPLLDTIERMEFQEGFIYMTENEMNDLLEEKAMDYALHELNE